MYNSLYFASELKAQNWRSTPAICPILASNAQDRRDQCPTPKKDPLASVQHPRGLIARGSHQSSAQTLTKWAPEVDFSTKRLFYPFLCNP